MYFLVLFTVKLQVQPRFGKFETFATFETFITFATFSKFSTFVIFATYITSIGSSVPNSSVPTQVFLVL